MGWMLAKQYSLLDMILIAYIHVYTSYLWQNEDSEEVLFSCNIFPDPTGLFQHGYGQFGLVARFHHLLHQGPLLPPVGVMLAGVMWGGSAKNATGFGSDLVDFPWKVGKTSSKPMQMDDVRWRPFNIGHPSAKQSSTDTAIDYSKQFPSTDLNSDN